MDQDDVIVHMSASDSATALMTKRNRIFVCTDFTVKTIRHVHVTCVCIHDCVDYRLYKYHYYYYGFVGLSISCVYVGWCDVYIPWEMDKHLDLVADVIPTLYYNTGMPTFSLLTCTPVKRPWALKSSIFQGPWVLTRDGDSIHLWK